MTTVRSEARLRNSATLLSTQTVPTTWFLRFLALPLVVLSLAIFSSTALCQEAAGFKHAPAKYLGVASCASSNCHGAVAPRDATNVLQNEYTTWSKHDSHAKAWLTLLNEDSKIIAEHLGIEKAEEDPWCLSCHATYVPTSTLLDEKFRIEDGVGCESCHGASEHYIGPHTEENSSHKRNLELGMLDIVSPMKRAEFCLTCHLGTDDKTVNHRLIGSGHPRLTFELDTFTALQPVHWDVDEDYRSRKEDYIPARAWLVGQVERAEELLAAIISKSRSRAGEGVLAGPELTLLYCYTCHHSLEEQQWRDRNYEGRPGELQLNLSSFVILEQALAVLDASASKALTTRLEELHSSGEPTRTSDALMGALSSARSVANSTTFDRANIMKLVRSLASFGASSSKTGVYPAFEVAEQVAMGISSLSSTVTPDGSLFKREIDQIFSALSNPDNFKPQLFASACEQLLLKL